MIRLAVESDPWKVENSYGRVSRILSGFNSDIRPDVAFWTNSKNPPFGADLYPNEILITSMNEPSFETINDFEKIGVKLLQLQRI